MTQVFISYSRRDLAFVEQLAADLGAAGLDVWYDLSGLEGGQRWRIEIEKAIRASQYVIIVLSPNSVDSEWVEREYLFANNLRKKIIPLFYKQCDLPMYYLNVHFINVQGDNYKRNFDEILRALNVKLIVQKKPVVTWKDILPKRKVVLQNTSLLVAFVGLILVALFGFSSLFSRSENTPVPTPEKLALEPIATATVNITITPNPSLTPTKESIPTITPLPTEIANDLGVGSSWTRPSDGMVMLYVPEGEFTMGSDTGADDEQPVHQVYLDSYWIDETEVTNTMYAQCVSASNCKNPASTAVRASEYDDYAVSYVNWEDAQNYCAWAEARLPTEAEWEKAARGGLEGMLYPWGNEESTCLPDSPNGAMTVSCSTDYPVKTFSPNGYGLYDMAGNAWEWVEDLYGSTYYSVSPTDNPTGPISGVVHVLRGGDGTWSGSEKYSLSVRISDRRGGIPRWDFLSHAGFRCAKDTTP